MNYRIRHIRVRILRNRRMHQHQQQHQQQPRHWHQLQAWHQPLVQHQRTSCRDPKRCDLRMIFQHWGEQRLLVHLPKLVQRQRTSCRDPRQCGQHMRYLHRDVRQCQLRILAMVQLIFYRFCIRSMWKRSLEHRLMARRIGRRKGHSRLSWLRQ